MPPIESSNKAHFNKKWVRSKLAQIYRLWSVPRNLHFMIILERLHVLIKAWANFTKAEFFICRLFPTVCHLLKGPSRGPILDPVLIKLVHIYHFCGRSGPWNIYLDSVMLNHLKWKESKMIFYYFAPFSTVIVMQKSFKIVHFDVKQRILRALWSLLTDNWPIDELEWTFEPMFFSHFLVFLCLSP